MRPKALPRLLLLWGTLLLTVFSCSNSASSPYDQSFLEFRLSPSSPLGYDDLQSIKVFADPYAAFNLLSIHDDGRSVLGAYDYNSESDIYMGFEYSALYTSRLEDLHVSVTRRGSQDFIDSADYTLSFMGEIPEDPADKPYIEISVSDAVNGVVLTAVQGAAGAPVITITEEIP